MSVKCSRTFTLSEAAGLDVFAYFKLDEASPANTLVDSVSAQNLAISSGTGVSVPGKIGTAMQIGNYLTTRWLDGPNTHWVLGPNFTIRFWLKLLYESGNNTILWAGNQWTFWILPDYFAPGDIALEFIVSTDPGSVAVDIPSVPLGVWNHIVCIFEEGVGGSVIINDGVPVTAAGTDPIYPYATLDLNLRGWNDMNADAIDEIGIWKRVLTPAEITNDYNSGTGRTYPDVP